MYKFVGNRILSTVQNALTGLQLSEWHSGYRAYRVAALADIPFADNSDGFDFDTEIILQLADAGKRIAEVPIPTYYGDEICYVNGIQYARDVVRHTAVHRLGRSGFGRGRLGHVEGPYAFKPSVHSSHGRILQLADGRGREVLDVGCGPGWMAGRLTASGHGDGRGRDGDRWRPRPDGAVRARRPRRRSARRGGRPLRPRHRRGHRRAPRGQRHDALVRLWPTMFAYQLVFEFARRGDGDRPHDGPN